LVTSTHAHMQFLHQQGASAADEAEVNKYYSSKKAARVQMLGELSGEFDPISDADSNYGRVLGLAHISRTNGVIPEDMDVSPEEKAPTQMLAMPDRFIRAKKIAQLTNTKNLYGTNAVSFECHHSVPSPKCMPCCTVLRAIPLK
jgi:hypothetical protein